MNSDESQQFEIPSAGCPACGSRHDAMSAVGHGARPEPGAVTVCVYCGVVLEMDDQLKTKIIDPATLDKGTRSVIERVVAEVRRGPLFKKEGRA